MNGTAATTATDSAPKSATIAAINQQLRTGQTTCEALVRTYLERIAARPSLNAFLEVWADEALQRAQAQDAQWQAGENPGRLSGIVIALKDNLCWRGHKVSAASKMLENFESMITATAVERLYNEGAIFIGRTNCDEFAMGSSNENSAFGPVEHPLDPQRVPGGSSGGSAVAVAAGLCHASLGSDTGGSIRQPAAFCGTVGYKPSYGRISRWGLIAFASSLDQIGPFTHSVEDAALLTEIMAGPDGRDATAISEAPEAYGTHVTSSDSNVPLCFGYLKETLDSPGLDPAVRGAFQESLERLRNAGHTVEARSFPYLDYMMPIYYLLAPAEASSNLGRYDGVRYGYRSPNAATLEDLYKNTRSEGFGPEVQRRILLGTFVLSEGYFDAYYTKAQQARRIVRDHTLELLADCDFLLTPTAPTPAFKRGEKQDPIAMYLADIFTVQASLAGLPAISLPMGNTEQGLPMGLQIMGRTRGDAELFAAAAQIERLVR